MRRIAVTDITPALALAIAATAGCRPACPACPAATTPPPAYIAPMMPATPTPPNATGPSKREKLAVLPIDDDELFRDERQQVRSMVATRLAALAPEYELLPLAEVDAGLRAVNKAGQACAYEQSPLSRRARSHGWRWTDLVFVSKHKGRGSELWVQLHGYTEQVSFAAPWEGNQSRLARYRTALSALAKLDPTAGLLGGLGASGKPKGELSHGSLRICEKESFFQCRHETGAWLDVGAQTSKCFAGTDEGNETALVEGTRCELENLDEMGSAQGKREACICAALAKSKGAAVRSGRRRVALSHEALDVVGKARPQLRVIDVSGLFAQDDWESIKIEAAGKTAYESVRRLEVDNLDALAAPLARCDVKPGTQLTAEIKIDATGRTTAVRITSGAPGKSATACLEKALQAGAFDCPRDNKGATLRVAIRYPD